VSGFVFDTCVVLDLHDAGLLHVAAHNLTPAHAGRLALAEPNELAPYQRDLERYGVRVANLTGPAIAAMGDIRRMHPGLSAFDVEAALVAQKRAAVLLTNERPLRRLAKDLDVEAHGSLWVLRTLADRAVIDPPRAVEALSALRRANARLPVAECERLRADLERRLRS
jgi:hypothetical protein